MQKTMAVGIVGMPVTEAYVGKGAFLRWLESFKVAQRPLWAVQEVNQCFICVVEFGFWERQHHCRKCGSAVCGKCAKYFVQIPEFGYYQRVRICQNCLEEMYKASKLQELKRQQMMAQLSHEQVAAMNNTPTVNESVLTSFYQSGADLQHSVQNYNSANIFKSQTFASLPMRLNQMNLHSGHDESLHGTNLYESG